MKITIELTDEDLAQGKLAQLGAIFGEPSTQPSPVKTIQGVFDERTIHSVGMYDEDNKKKEKPETEDVIVSQGEGILRELVALWLDCPNHTHACQICRTDRGDEIMKLGENPHTKRAILKFVGLHRTLSHAVQYIRVKWGGESSAWRETEEIAMNIQQISSIRFPELANTYTAHFKWENNTLSPSLNQRA